MKQATFSFYDSRGMLWVDCTECKRGFYGKGDCSSGKKVRKIRKGGCFSGVLRDGFEAEKRIEKV